MSTHNNLHDFTQKNRIIRPRQGFLHDIKEEIDKWKADRYRILLMGDFNDYIFSHTSCQFLAEIGLREIIIEKHGE